MARKSRERKSKEKGPQLLAEGGFARWRQVRPFWAGAFMIFAGLEIGWWPLAPVHLLLQTGLGGLSAVLFTVLLVSDGLVVWFSPQYRTILGIQAAIVGVLSVVTTNLGGFFVGAFAAMIGGAMAVAWEPPRRIGDAPAKKATGTGPAPEPVPVAPAPVVPDDISSLEDLGAPVAMAAAAPSPVLAPVGSLEPEDMPVAEAVPVEEPVQVAASIEVPAPVEVPVAVEVPAPVEMPVAAAVPAPVEAPAPVEVPVAVMEPVVQPAAEPVIAAAPVAAPPVAAPLVAAPPVAAPPVAEPVPAVAPAPAPTFEPAPVPVLVPVGGPAFDDPTESYLHALQQVQYPSTGAAPAVPAADPARPRPKPRRPRANIVTELENVEGSTAEATEGAAGSDPSRPVARIGTLIALLLLGAGAITSSKSTPASAAPLCGLLNNCATSSAPAPTASAAPTATKSSSTPTSSAASTATPPLTQLLPNALSPTTAPTVTAPAIGTARPFMTGLSAPIVAGGKPFLLKIGKATLTNPHYVGNVNIPTAKGTTVLAMHLTFDITINDVTLDDSSGPADIRVAFTDGQLIGVNFYATKLTLNALGIPVPLTFTPSLPPSVANLTPVLPATNLVVDCVYFSAKTAILNHVSRVLKPH